MKRTPFLLAFIFSISLGATGAADTRPKLILDADTANEIDDLYAIVRILKQEKFEVLGLNSAQWFHYLGERDSVQASQKLNEDLLEILDRKDLPALLGSAEPMGRPWGGNEPKNSVAARFIIEQAKAMPDGEKLNVVCIGASTNLASAIKLAPEIAPKIRAHLLGFRYDFEKGIWNKSEFNIRRDLNAADYLLNKHDLELHIMTATVSGDLKVDRDQFFADQEKMGELGQYLTARWIEHAPEAKRWTMWDLALVIALIHPELTREIEVITPPENFERQVFLYDSIDAEAMIEDYRKTVLPR
ncbi:MAG: nucleoside hydrolase [Verrucomicrobiae bacterium]|nr:nucleoside hydrolase [Verrucomicrobiae bacterium]